MTRSLDQRLPVPRVVQATTIMYYPEILQPHHIPMPAAEPGQTKEVIWNKLKYLH